MIGIKTTENFTLEKKEITLFILQAVFILSIYFFDSIFWIFFFGNIILLMGSMFWIFGVRPSKEELKTDFIYFFMPVSYFVSTIFFMTTVKSFFLQVIFLAFYLITNYIFIKNMVAVKENSEDCSISSRNIVSMLTFLIVFLSISDLTNLFVFYKIPQFIFLGLSFFITGLMTYFLFIQYELWDSKTKLFTYLISFVMAQTLWVGTFWTVNYPKSQIGEIGIPLIAILALVVYYTIWGIAHHKLTNTLTKKVLTEYLMIAGVIIFILLTTTRWIPQGLIG